MSDQPSASQANNKRIAKNTMVLYVRMLFMMAVMFYTSRVVLQALGFTDYGIYNAVGGFVAMFGVISNSLTAAISRFITFEIGHGDIERLRRIFSTSLVVQCLLAGAIVILMESIGIWFLNYHMTIPSDRIVAANFVIQFSILAFVIQLISVPYNAAIIAHEHMTAYAIISILNGVGTLLVALVIQYGCSSFDRLIVYSLLLVLLALVIRIIYGVYCRKHFAECKFRLIYDRGLTKEITSFASWNFFGASSAVLRDQGINVLLNVFCGPVVNAARGIAMQTSGAFGSFSGSFLSAISPQITKQYASGDNEYALKLCFNGSRFAFYLLLLLSLPIFLEVNQVLSLWLGQYPPHTVAFVRLIVIYCMVESLSSTLITLMLATGDIKKYQIIVGGTQLLNFPVAYVILKLGGQPEYTMVATIVIALICMMFRLLLLRKMVGLSIRRFVKEVLFNIIAVCIVAAILPFTFVVLTDSSWLRFAATLFLCVFTTALSVYFVGCGKNERLLLNEKIKSYITKLNRK